MDTEPISVCVDGNNQVAKLWHVAKEKAVAIFLDRLVALRRLVKHGGRFATAWDSPGGTFRHEIYPEYKADRPPTDPSLRDTLAAARDAAKPFGRVLAVRGYEADDLLSTFARDCREAGHRAVLVTNDKDARQLLGMGSVTICRDLKRHQNDWAFEWYTADNLHTDYGLRPEQWPDYQALVGDASDSVHGCPGIGQKTACELLHAHGTLAAILAAPEACAISKSKLASLVAWSPTAETILRVVRLRDDVPLDDQTPSQDRVQLSHAPLETVTAEPAAASQPVSLVSDDPSGRTVTTSVASQDGMQMVTLMGSQTPDAACHTAEVVPQTEAENAVKSGPGMVLSLFPGIDLFGMAFEREGFCVVQGPEKQFGRDIRDFHPRPGWAWLVIAGTPCQDFSTLRRSPPTGYGKEMIDQFVRVVTESDTECWLLENVPGVPDVRIPGYNWQRFELNQSWFVQVSRLRHFQFGSRSGVILNPPKGTPHPECEGAALATDDRPFRTVCRLQGLPDDFELPGMTAAGAVAAVGNGVPLVVGRAIARCVLSAYGHSTADEPVTDYAAVASLIRCACGCGRVLTGRQKTASAACRQRLHRKRRPATGSQTNAA